MNPFYFVLLALLVPISLFLWWQAQRADSHKRLAIRQLTEALQSSVLSESERNELQRQLAQAVVHARHGDTRAWWVPALVIAIGGLFLYQKTGMPSATDAFVYAAGSANSRNVAASNTPPDMQTAIAALKERIAADPDKLENHLLYGRAMMAMKNYPEAVSAYETARRLQPENSWVLASLAEAKAFAAGQGNFRGEPEKLLKQALALDPDNQKALWLLGMNALEQGHFEQAERLWTHLLGLVENPRVAEQLQSQINLARQQQGKPALNTNREAGQQPTSKKPVNLTVQVDISPDMQARLKDKPAVLYVYAKPTSGMPMPIAVVRGNASDFPLVVQLGDTNNLQANRPLSGFDQVAIGARISFSGNAMPQPGDIEADEIIVPVPGQHDQPISLILNKIR